MAFFYWEHNTQVVAVPTNSVNANLVFNEVTRNFRAVTIQGQFNMPRNGVIFSDGIEEDHLDFNSGTIATIGLADRTLRLVVPG